MNVNPRGGEGIIEARINMHNAGEFALGCNLLLIDIDSNDFWVMDGALRRSSPSVIVCEINTRFEREESYTVPYDPDMQWDGTNLLRDELGGCDPLGCAPWVSAGPPTL